MNESRNQTLCSERSEMKLQFDSEIESSKDT